MLDRAALCAELAAYFATRRANIAAVYLFGSRARGDPREDSDVDVAILFLADPPATLDGMGFGIADELRQCVDVPVDVVVLNRAPPDLVHRVLRDETIAFEADRSARIAFEVAARNRYFDILPHLRRYRRQEGTTP